MSALGRPYTLPTSFLTPIPSQYLTEDMIFTDSCSQTDTLNQCPFFSNWNETQDQIDQSKDCSELTRDSSESIGDNSENDDYSIANDDSERTDESSEEIEPPQQSDNYFKQNNIVALKRKRTISLERDFVEKPLISTDSYYRKCRDIVSYKESSEEDFIEPLPKKLKLPSKTAIDLFQTYPQLANILLKMSIKGALRKKILNRLDDRNRIFTIFPPGKEISQTDHRIKKLVNDYYGKGASHKRNKYPPCFTAEQVISKLLHINKKTKEIACNFFINVMGKNEIKNLITRVFDVLCHEYVIENDVDLIKPYMTRFLGLDKDMTLDELQLARVRIIDNLNHKAKDILDELNLCREIKKQLKEQHLPC